MRDPRLHDTCPGWRSVSAAPRPQPRRGSRRSLGVGELRPRHVGEAQLVDGAFEGVVGVPVHLGADPQVAATWVQRLSSSAWFEKNARGGPASAGWKANISRPTVRTTNPVGISDE